MKFTVFEASVRKGVIQPVCSNLPSCLHPACAESWSHFFFSVCSQVEIGVLLFIGTLEAGCKFSLMLLLCIALAQCQKSVTPEKQGPSFLVLQFALLRVFPPGS